MPDLTSLGFHSWFKGSKIVDASGNPLRMFHGSRPHAPEIKEFHTPEGDGAYFTPDPQYAEGFTNDITGKLQDCYGAMYPVYLSIKNPYVVYAKDPSPAYLKFIERGFNTEQLKRKGYDGAMLFVDGFGLDQVIAFRPDQIRSAIAERPDIEPQSALDLTQGKPTVPSQAARSLGSPLGHPITGWEKKTVVRTKQGTPMIVFHGTDKDFSQFADRPTWFIGNADLATDYGTKFVKPVNLDIRRPYVSSHRENARLGAHRLVAKAIAAGHDGIVIPADKSFAQEMMYYEALSDVFVVCSSEQIHPIEPGNT